MRQRGIFIILGGICFSILILTLFKSESFNSVFAQETLSCEVRNSACGDTKPVEVFRMSNTTNAHAGTPTGSNYTYRVCCGGITGLGNSCTEGVTAVVLRLSGATNAHARQNSYEDYSGANKACLSVPSGSVGVTYVAGNSSCPSGYATLASMSGATNAHVGSPTAYTGASNYKICATASAGLSTAIKIRAQDYTSAVSTITFPEGAPGATVSQPYNNIDGTGSPQTFGGAGSAKPVVTLYNSGSGSLIIWYHITSFTNSVVSSEYYLVNNKGAACNSADDITNAVTFDADTSTGITIAPGAGNEKDFYLKVVLSSVAGKTGSSTLTILGETP